MKSERANGEPEPPPDASGSGPARLGNLERAFMEALWDAHGTAISARDVQAACSDRRLAYATVRTVLNRLSDKGLVLRKRSERAWLYAPVAPREAFVAELMLQALNLTGDREAALAAFARVVNPAEAEALREALEGDGQNE